MLTRGTFLWMATLFEGGLVVIAYLIGVAVDIDPLAALEGSALEGSLIAIVRGLMGSLPLYLLLVVTWNRDALSPLRELLTQKVGPLLSQCGGLDLLYIALLAGVTEEILFRGCLQPWFEVNWGWLGGLLFSNLIFGVVHWVSPLYALMAFLAGLYLGIWLDVGGERNLLVPITIHATYDWLAFHVVIAGYRTSRRVKARHAEL